MSDNFNKLNKMKETYEKELDKAIRREKERKLKLNEKIFKKNKKLAFELFRGQYISGKDSLRIEDLNSYYYVGGQSYRGEYTNRIIHLLSEAYPELEFQLSIHETRIWWRVKDESKDCK